MPHLGKEMSSCRFGMQALEECLVDYSVGDPVDWDAANDRGAPPDTGERINVAESSAGATATTVEVGIG